MEQIHYIYFKTKSLSAADVRLNRSMKMTITAELKKLSVDPNGDVITYSWTISGQAGHCSKSSTIKDVTIPGSVIENNADKCIFSLQATNVVGLVRKG